MLGSLGDTSSFEANFVALLQGWLALTSGDYHRAEERLERTLTLGRVLDAKGILSAALAFMGELALSRGDVKPRPGITARVWSSAGRGISRSVWPTTSTVWSGWGARSGNFAPAVRLVGALDEFAGQVQNLPGLVTATREDDIARMREALGGEAFTTAREAGRALPLQEAITEAIELADELLSEAKVL